MASLWLTRPRPDSEALAAQLSLPCIISPVMHVLPSPIADLGERPMGIILTSRHGLLAPIPRDWRDLPVYCVGPATTAHAMECGFAQAQDCGGDALSLAAYIAAHVPGGSILTYLAGEETRVDLATLLAARGIFVRTVLAYQSLAEPTITEELFVAFQKASVRGVVCFSPRSASLVVDLMRHYKLTTHAPNMNAYCLSVAVAEFAGKLPWKTLEVAHTPTTTAMVELIERSAMEEA